MKIKESLSTIIMACMLATYIAMPISATVPVEKYQFMIGTRDLGYFQTLFLKGFKASEKELNNKTSAASQLEPAQQRQAIYRWMIQNQQKSALGLVTSYPDHQEIEDQAFAYDQALAGIVLLKQGDTDAARKLFEFFQINWDGHGLWTVYNSEKSDGPKIEYLKIMGPNAWVGLFSLQYFAKTGDPRALRLATDIATWIAALPHRNGGVAMGDGEDWKNSYSVENNLNYFALLKYLSKNASSPSEREFFTREFVNLKKWFKHDAYNSGIGLFRRGAYRDSTQALDSNTWAILVFGPAELKKLFQVDANYLIKKAESIFTVQEDGSFSENVLSAKGFDFSNAYNADLNQRHGIKWVEGTNQMTLAYKVMADHYLAKGPGGKNKAFYYNNRYEYFLGRNADNRVSQNDTAGYLYTDLPGAKVWADNPYWFASKGPSVAATAWVYFSLNGINPFIIQAD